MKGIAAILQQSKLSDTTVFKLRIVMDGLVNITVSGEGEVDWGDGSPREIYSGTGAISHTYAAFDGDLTFFDELTRFEFSEDTASLYYNIEDIPNGMTNFSDTCDNGERTGSINALPTTLTEFEVSGDNILSGSISTLHEGLLTLRIHGSNTITGDVGLAPRSLTTLRVFGVNTISGDIGAMPLGTTHFYIAGQNTLTGTLDTVPSWGSIFSVKSDTNTVGGDLADLGMPVEYFSLVYNSHIDTYTGGLQLTDEIYHFEVEAADGYGLDSAEMDQILIDLDAIGMGASSSECNIILIGGNAFRTTASDAAVASLEARGVIVTVNGVLDVGFEARLIMDGTFTVTLAGDGFVDWGDGSPVEPFDSNTEFTHDYTAFDGTFTVIGELTYYKNTTAGSILICDLSDIPSTVYSFTDEGDNEITGDLGDLPVGMTSITLAGNNIVTGDIGDLPVGITYYRTYGLNTTYGDIANLPPTLERYYNQGDNQTTGSLSSLPPTIIRYYNRGLNTVSEYTTGYVWNPEIKEVTSHPATGSGFSTGEVDAIIMDLDAIGMYFDTAGHIGLDGNNAPRSIASNDAVASLESRGITVDVSGVIGEVFTANLVMDGDFEIEVAGTGVIDWGDGSPTENYDGTDISLSHTYAAFDGIVTFTGTLTSFYNNTEGSNFYHDVATLPRDMTYYGNYGDNEVYGNLSNLPPNLTGFYLSGNNTVIGAIADLPRTLTSVYILGEAQITGDIIDMPPDATYWAVYGIEIYTGDIANLPATLVTIDAGGANTLYGDVSTLKPDLNWFELSGDNIVTGDVATLPTAMSGWLSVSGQNTLSGDLANIPAGIYHFSLGGENTIHDYTFPRVWPADMDYVRVDPYGEGLDVDEVDNLIIDLDNSGMSEGIIWVLGQNAPRSNASDTAVANLEGRGVVVEAYQSDTEPPIVGTLTHDQVTSTSVRLNCTATDNVGVTVWTIRDDDIVYENYDTNGDLIDYILDGLESDTEYNIYVRPFDAAGNSSVDYSNTVTFTTESDIPLDTEPPVAGELTIDEVATTSCRLHCIATDNVGVEYWDIIIGGSWDSLVNQEETLDHVLTGLNPDTSYDISVLPHDAADNYDTSNTVNITTLPDTPPSDTEAPVLSEFIIDEVTTTSCRLHCTATDNIGIDHWEIRIDGSFHGSSDDTDTLDHVISGLSPDTEYSIIVQAYDAADNYDVSDEVIITTLSDTPPGITHKYVFDGSDDSYFESTANVFDVAADQITVVIRGALIRNGQSYQSFVGAATTISEISHGDSGGFFAYLPDNVIGDADRIPTDDAVHTHVIIGNSVGNANQYYYDGVLAGELTATDDAFVYDLIQIGAWGGGQILTGEMHAVYIFDRLLTPAEITALQNDITDHPTDSQVLILKNHKEVDRWFDESGNSFHVNNKGAVVLEEITTSG